MEYSKYYSEIMKEPLLSDDEEKALFEEYHSEDTSEKRKDQIKDRIIRANLRFVFKSAKDRSQTDPRQFEDLILAGNEGLLVGFEKYDHKSGYKFLTYAGWWVMQRQLKEMSMMRVVALPIWKQQLARKIQKKQDKLDHPLIGQELYDAFPDHKKADLDELSMKKYLTYGFDDVYEHECTISPIEEQVDSAIDNKMLMSKLDQLGEPYKSILSMTYGLENGKEHKAAYISKVLKLTQDTIRVKRREGIQMLRHLYKQ